jgi:hypothetical protein
MNACIPICVCDLTLAKTTTIGFGYGGGMKLYVRTNVTTASSLTDIYKPGK